MPTGTAGPATVATPRQGEQVLPARPDQVRVARAFLATVLAGCPAADDAILCLSELASNSVLHSASRHEGGTFTIRAEMHSDYARIEVTDDGGPWNEHPRRDGYPHGLDIVRALAADCGIDGDPHTGWTVWARFTWA
jgi:Histidine kinase-like ATPase domain